VPDRTTTYVVVVRDGGVLCGRCDFSCYVGVASAAAASNDRRCTNYRDACVQLAAPRGRPRRSAAEICGRRTRPSVDADSQELFRSADWRRRLAPENSQMRTDADHLLKLGTRQADLLSTVSRCYSIVLTVVFDLSHPWPCSAAAAVNCSSVTQHSRLRWIGHTAAAGSLWGMEMRICGQNPRTDADAKFQDPHISGLRREWSTVASADLRVWFGSVRFRPEQICAVTDSVSEQQRLVCSISNGDTWTV